MDEKDPLEGLRFLVWCIIGSVVGTILIRVLIG